MGKKTKLEELKNVRDIQGYNGNWNYSEYMMGMYNGLELALAIFEEREPDYKSAPKKWGNDEIKEESQGFRQKLKDAWRKTK